MFYGKDMIDANFTLLQNKLDLQQLFLFEPIPSYKVEKEGSRWTDDLRIRDGHTKLDDGSWVTIHKATTWLEKLKKDTTDLYEQNQKTNNELMLARKRIREMEYGLRVAEKALKNSLTMTKEMLDE
jgi:hypothetical protein